MDRSNLDVWAVQKYPDELNKALATLVKPDEMILYTDLFCDFQIGKTRVETKQFHTALESKANDVLILFADDPKVSREELQNYLKQYHTCHTVSFLGNSETKYQNEDSIIWLARDVSVLEDAVLDTLENGTNDCDFYPYVGGHCDLKYSTNDYESYFLIDGRKFRGVLQMGDKLVLLIQQNQHENVTVDQVFRLMQKYNMDCHYYECGEPDLSLLAKQPSHKS